MLYLVDYLANAERDPKLLKQPLQFIDSRKSSSLIRNLMERIRTVFGNQEPDTADLNREKILGYLEGFKSQYAEINEFRDKTEDYAKKVLS